MISSFWETNHMVVSPQKYVVKYVIENGNLVPVRQNTSSKLQVCQLTANVTNVYSHSLINGM